MISTFAKFLLTTVYLTVLTAPSWVSAAVEITPQKTLMTDGGKIMIYDRTGNLTDTVEIGPHVDQIEIGPSGERLLAASRENKTVEIITLDFIHEINTLGAPSKGPHEAPVVIVVFSDFQ